MKLIIAIVGLTGAGKSVATAFFESRGFHKIRFGQVTMDTLEKEQLEANEKNERRIREHLRKEHGMAAYAILNIPKIEKAMDEGNNVVIDGLYSWEEYKTLKDRFGKRLVVLTIHAGPEKRYRRLAVRRERPLTFDEAKSRDYAEIENIEKAGPISMADFSIVNNGTIQEFQHELLKIYGLVTGKRLLEKEQRPTKVDYYLRIARQVCKRSTCLRRRFGAVIVSKSDKIIATGYNGAIRKAVECMAHGRCMREALNIPPGERYELCKAFHAEQNAILSAEPAERRGATLYLYGEDANGNICYGEPCMLCKRMIVQGEIERVVARQPDGSIKEFDASQFVVEENLGKNFPNEITNSSDFEEYIKETDK